jgi:hypothetical protein
MAVNELKQSFNAVEKRSKDKVQELTKKLNEQKAQTRSLSAYARELK